MRRAVGLALLWLAACGGGGGAVDAASPADTASAPDAAPPPGLPSTCDPPRRFCEQGSSLGLHDDPPAFGRGAALVDLDGDGWDDLWRTDSGTGVLDHAGVSGMYRNRGDGTFEPWDVGLPAEHLRGNWSAAFGDLDDDGDPDLFLANGGYVQPERARLYRNDLSTTGRLTDVTDAAGIPADPRAWWGASFADYDLDGDLDVAAVALVLDDPDPPADTLVLLRNDGALTFTEVSADVGLPDPQGDNKALAWADLDDDGDPDLLLASQSPLENEAARAGLFWNRGEAGFEQAPASVFPGAAFSEGSQGFGVGVADFDQDGRLDVYLGRMFDQDYLLLNDGAGGFTPLGPEAGIDMRVQDPVDNPEPLENSMGLAVGDLDADGYPEALVGPGSPFETGAPIVLCHRGPPLRFTRCFEDIGEGAGPGRNHGAALGDVDHDGDVDVFWNLGGAAFAWRELGIDSRQLPALFVQHPPPGAPHTAALHLVGTASNRDALGARVRVQGDRERHYLVSGVQGFVSQSSAWLTVSLGEHTEGTVTIRWPSGRTQTVPIEAGERREIREGE